jgi:hypothetical protein
VSSRPFCEAFTVDYYQLEDLVQEKQVNLVIAILPEKM